MAEVMQMAEAAQKTAEEAKTAAEAREGVQDTIEEEAEAKGLELTEDQAKMIASITIAELERRGAFPDADGEEGEPSGEPPAPAAPPVEGAPPAEPPAPAGEPPVVPEEAPKKKTLAERFRGA